MKSSRFVLTILLVLVQVDSHSLRAALLDADVLQPLQLLFALNESLTGLDSCSLSLRAVHLSGCLALQGEGTSTCSAS